MAKKKEKTNVYTVWLYTSHKLKIYSISKMKPPVMPKTGMSHLRFENKTELKEFLETSKIKNYEQVSYSEFMAKAFPEEASKEYYFDIHLKIASEEKCNNSVKYNLSPGEAIAYVDGSFVSGRKASGSGIVFITADKTIRMCSATKKAEYLVIKQIAGELIAVIIAINKAKEENCSSLIIKYDFDAIQKMADGTWGPRTELTQAYVDYINRARQDGLNISFEKIKAHSGDWGNADADALAKLATKA